jgi:hypothetical protein
MEIETGKHPPAECPEGFDYRQLRAYLRSSEGEDSVPLPPGVWSHIEQCHACLPKWRFLERTDPIVKRQFQSRVLRFLDRVSIQEVVFKPVEQPPVIEPQSTYKVMAAIAGSGQSVITTSYLREPLTRILEDKAPLEPRFVVGVVDSVLSIPNEAERLRNGKTVAAVFNGRLKKKEVSQEQIVEVLSKLTVSNRMELLADELTATAAAIIPETCRATDPPLMTMVGGKAMFNAPELRRLRGMVGS